MRLLVPSVVALVYLCLAALLPASSAFKGPLKPRNELDRPRLHNVAVPAAGPDDYAPGPGHYDDYAAGPYAYGPEQYDYDYEFTLSPIVEAPEAQPPTDPNYRGLKIAFHYDIHPSRRRTGEGMFVKEQLMPAVAATLRRSVRVRRPTGPINLGDIFYPGETFQQTLDYLMESFGTANRKELESIVESDVDYVMVVKVPKSGAKGCGGLGYAAALALHKTTHRPLIGEAALCIVQEFELSLQTMVHEAMHALGLANTWFSYYQGYKHISEVVEVTPEKFQPSYDSAGYETAETMALVTPNVRRVAREHFGCDTLTGAELEDDGSGGSAFSHWEERIFQGEAFDWMGDAGSKTRFATSQVLTDQTLAWLQDSGWYDVKYGSMGFNSFGYQGGCAFANGTVAEARASPAASRYICMPEDAGQYVCTHDHVASAFCYNEDYTDYNDYIFGSSEGLQDIHTGLWSDTKVDGRLCVKKTSKPGSRCIKPLSSDPDGEPDNTMCVEMTCSPQGEVLINGAPCNPDKMKCPDSGYLCDDPGVLTCAATLNDCSGRGDCLKGACYCHLGWGGEDCSVPICLPSVGCDDGNEECPESGFCAVPESGAWSEWSVEEAIEAQDREVVSNGAHAPSKSLGYLVFLCCFVAIAVLTMGAA